MFIFFNMFSQKFTFFRQNSSKKKKNSTASATGKRFAFPERRIVKDIVEDEVYTQNIVNGTQCAPKLKATHFEFFVRPKLAKFYPTATKPHSNTFCKQLLTF